MDVWSRIGMSNISVIARRLANNRVTGRKRKKNCAAKEDGIMDEKCFNYSR